MRAALRSTILLMAAAFSMLETRAQSGTLAALDDYNVLWTTPSRDASGAMPIGNGEVGLSVWVEEGGDLLFYVSRTDAWSEACRLLKLCRVRVRFDPNPFRRGMPFRQELILREGRIRIEGEEAWLDVFVDAEAPVAWVMGSFKGGRKVTASLETWRNAPKKELKGQELDSSWTMRGSPGPVYESGDFFSGTPESVELIHRNAWSIVPLTLRHQGLEAVADKARDPLLRRTFGTRMAARGFLKKGPRTIESKAPTPRFALQLATDCRQTESLAEWSGNVRNWARENADSRRARERTARWWREFWRRSWVFVTGDAGEAAKSKITEAYTLQRYMIACQGRGNYPIKFNGGIFTVEPSAMGFQLDPDWRRWGDAYWWQNTRFPYHAMLPAGDFEMMEPLFRMYEDALPLCEARAKLYHGVSGAYFPETMTIFGTYANGDYGWDRTGRRPNEVLCPWWQWAWNQGPELLGLMLDRDDYAPDERFFLSRVEPVATKVLAYFDSRFKQPDGKLRLSPTQAVETYWTSVVNDTPTVAGISDALRRWIERRKTLRSRSALGVSQKQGIHRTPRDAVAPIPLKDGKIQPAEAFDPKRSNVENPEFYAIWPFRLFGVGRSGLDVAQKTFGERVERSNLGWQYDGQVAALCGLTDEAKASLLAKVANSHPAYRWPATWGPNYDWLPDQCHGSNIMITLQTMLLQPVGDKLYVLPAWPKEWSVRFRLRAPHRSVVECEVRDGKLVRLEVNPKERRQDVVLPDWIASGTFR